MSSSEHTGWVSGGNRRHIAVCAGGQYAWHGCLFPEKLNEVHLNILFACARRMRTESATELVPRWLAAQDSAAKPLTLSVPTIPTLRTFFSVLPARRRHGGVLAGYISHQLNMSTEAGPVSTKANVHDLARSVELSGKRVFVRVSYATTITNIIEI